MFLSPARGRGEERGLRKLEQPPLPTSPPNGGEEHEGRGDAENEGKRTTMLRQHLPDTRDFLVRL